MSELIGIMKETSKNGIDSSLDDIGSIEEMPEETILSRQTSVTLVPFNGQRFISQVAAYEFHCSFAKQCGFSIRRHRTRGKDGVGRGITRKDFTCHRGGHPQLKPSNERKLQRNRKSSRCRCQAYMRIVKRVDFDVPEWQITGFSNVHNHELLKSNKVAAIVEFKDEAGGMHKNQRKVLKISLKTRSLMESHAAAVLTPYAFSKLQEKLVLAPQYASLMDMVDETYFIVRHHAYMDGGCKVL